MSTDGDTQLERPDWDYDALRFQVDEALVAHQGHTYAYSEADLQRAKADKSALSKLKDLIEGTRKAFKKWWLQPGLQSSLLSSAVSVATAGAWHRRE